MDFIGTAGKIQAQGTSFTDELLSMINVRSIYVKNNSASNGIDVGINLQDAINSVVEYNFKYNSDSLLLLRGVRTGSILPSQVSVAPTLKGVFINSRTHYHTVTVGDSFSFKFTGTELEFRLPTESRGGMWEFKLSNGKTTNISCYDVSAVLKGKQVNVFNGLEYATYYCVATYIGDDPENPPSSTPSRGYLYNSESSWTLREENKNGFINSSSAKGIISSSTISDFAIAARPSGQTYSSEWVPAHAVSNVSLNKFIKVFIDGIDVIATGGQLLAKTYTDVKSFQIVQSFDANNPNGDHGTLWKHYVSHIISAKEPCCKINNKMEFAQDTLISSAYLTMLGVNSANVSRLALNNGVEFSSIPNDGSNSQFDYDVSSAMYAGEYEPGRTHAVSIDVSSYAEAVGLRYRPETDKTLPGLLTFRADNVAKFYLLAVPNNTVLQVGNILRNTQRIAVVTGVIFPNTLLKTI